MGEVDKWREYASRLNFPRPEYAEKDYLQELVLQELSSASNDLVFRGGTALSKFYGSGRFSEDIDLVLIRGETADSMDRTLKQISNGVNSIKNYFDITLETERYKDMVEYSIKIKGPLYIASGNEAAIQRVSIDLNTREIPLKKPGLLFRTPLYQDIRNYSFFVEELDELLADKVKAAIERHEKEKDTFIRDLYDIWTILKKYGIKIDFKMVKEKMRRYGIKPFFMEDFIKCINDAKSIWDKEISALMRAYPKYSDVYMELIHAAKNTSPLSKT